MTEKVKKEVKMEADTVRISVFRSNRAIYAQAMDISNGFILAAAASTEIKEKGNKSTLATKTGELLAKKLTGAKISKIYFDRNGFRYHGRVKSLADGARAAGLKF